MITNIYIYFKKSFIIICFLFLYIFEISAIFRHADEYTIKAAFIEKFTRFIDWPKNCNIYQPKSNFIFGIFGEDEIISNFTTIFKNKTILTKKVDIIKINELKDINNCNLLFIRSIDKNKLEEILEFVRKKPILTISDSKGFAKKGVMINFKFDNEKISYEINQPAYIKAGFSFSYLLLQRGHIIKTREKNL